MGFQKGHKKTGGIKKGQITKKKQIQLALAERLTDFDNKLYEVSQELLNDPKTKSKAWETLMKLRVPAITKIQGDKDNPIQLQIEVTKFI